MSLDYLSFTSSGRYHDLNTKKYSISLKKDIFQPTLLYGERNAFQNVQILFI